MERINNPSLEFLLGLKHGQKVNVSIRGTECEAIVNANELYFDEKAIFLCQNKRCGSVCNDKMGKDCSWIVWNELTMLQIDWIELVEDWKDKYREFTAEFDGKIWNIISENSVTIPTEETIDFDEYDLLAIEFIKLAMKK